MRRYLQAAVATASALRHPAYDCIYLCLADELARLPVTADARLVALARSPAARRFRDRVIGLDEVPQRLA